MASWAIVLLIAGIPSGLYGLHAYYDNCFDWATSTYEKVIASIGVAIFMMILGLGFSGIGPYIIIEAIIS